MTIAYPGLTFHNYAHALPDLAGYAKAGLIPTNPELAEAIARHARLVDKYHEATADRDEADAKMRNVQAATKAITLAILAGNDPGEAADKAAAERAQTQRAAARATEILAGYSTPILQSAWAVMGLVEQYAPAAAKALEPHMVEQADAVDKARVVLAKAEAALRETLSLGAWIDATHQTAGEMLPGVDASVHLFEG